MRVFFLTILCSLFVGTLSAQTYEIKGSVKDASGVPLPGVQYWKKEQLKELPQTLTEILYCQVSKKEQYWSFPMLALKHKT